MATLKQINERKQLKQKLWKIRLYVDEGRGELTSELLELKEHYESIPGFTKWGDFPERWDIGDPHRVKEKAWGNEIDRRNFARAFGKPYEEIVHKFVAKSNELVVYANGE